jgi:hypothetical protein
MTKSDALTPAAVAALSKYCYLASKVCGCVQAGILDKPELRLETAETVAQWIRGGFIVERLPISDPLNVIRKCYHEGIYYDAS